MSLGEVYWETRQHVRNKLGKKDDAHIIASDAELDAKLEVFRAIQKSCLLLLHTIERYQDKICELSKGENATGRFLKSRSNEDHTRAGKMMASAGKALAVSSTQRLALREPLVRLYHEVETFRYRAITDTLVTINRMEKARTEYRAALAWMKDVSEELNPDAYSKMEKFRRVQAQVKRTKDRFDRLKLDTMQKIDLLAASRCNMYSHVLAKYQTALLTFWSKTSRTLNAVHESFKGYQYYEFSMLKELAEPSRRLADETSSPSGTRKKGNDEKVGDKDEKKKSADANDLEEDVTSKKTEDDELISLEEEMREIDNQKVVDELDESDEQQPFDWKKRIKEVASSSGDAVGKKQKKLIDDSAKDLLTGDEENFGDKDDLELLNDVLGGGESSSEFARQWNDTFGKSMSPIQTPQSMSQTTAASATIPARGMMSKGQQQMGLGREEESQVTDPLLPANLWDLAAASTPDNDKNAMNQKDGSSSSFHIFNTLIGQKRSNMTSGEVSDGTISSSQEKPSHPQTQQQMKTKNQREQLKQRSGAATDPWLNLFADLDPLSDPDEIGRRIRQQKFKDLPTAGKNDAERQTLIEDESDGKA